MADRLAKQQEIWTDIQAGIAAGGASLAGFLIVPMLLQQLGMDFVGAYTAFAVMSIAGTLWMGIMRLPLLIMPSVAISGSMVYILGISQGFSWQQLLGISFAASFLGMLLFLGPWGQKVNHAVPGIIHRLIPAGLGVMLIMLGLTQGRIVIRSAWSVTMLGNFQDPLAYLGLTGILLTLGMLAMKVRGALLYGFVLTAGLAFTEGFWVMPTAPFLLPGGMNLTAGQLTLPAADGKSFWQMAVAVLTLLIMLSCMNWGGIRALCPDKKRIDRPLTAVFGVGVLSALLGSLAPVIAPASAVGVMSGARGRWASLGTVAVFIVALFCEPIVHAMADFPVMVVPVMVGTGLLLLQETVKNLCEEDFSWKLPEVSAATSLLLIMPLSGSVTAGLGAATVGWCFLTALDGRWKGVSGGTWILTVCFVIYFAFAVI